MTNLPISQWPLHERPREKLLTKGAETLSDAELFAIFFRTGLKGKTAVDLAREALQHAGGLRQLLNLSPQAFCKARGLGMAKYIQLQASIELGKRFLKSKIDGQDVLNCPNDTRQFLMSRLRDRRQEVFACLFLNTKHHVIAFEELFQGTVDSAEVHPRIIVERTLHHNAAALILCHNHPSGNATPSYADIQITRKIINALAFIDVRILDHFIVGEGEVVSLAERGEI
jgi:DNA repair protein RadC